MKDLKTLISEYFLWTETKKFYDAKIATISEFCTDKSLKPQTRNIREIETTFKFFWGYIHNIGNTLPLRIHYH